MEECSTKFLEIARLMSEEELTNPSNEIATKLDDEDWRVLCYDRFNFVPQDFEADSPGTTESKNKKIFFNICALYALKNQGYLNLNNENFEAALNRANDFAVFCLAPGHFQLVDVYFQLYFALKNNKITVAALSAFICKQKPVSFYTRLLSNNTSDSERSKILERFFLAKVSIHFELMERLYPYSIQEKSLYPEGYFDKETSEEDRAGMRAAFLRQFDVKLTDADQDYIAAQISAIELKEGFSLAANMLR